VQDAGNPLRFLISRIDQSWDERADLSLICEEILRELPALLIQLGVVNRDTRLLNQSPHKGYFIVGKFVLAPCKHRKNSDSFVIKDQGQP